MKKLFLLFIMLIVFSACNHTPMKQADLIVTNALVYTCNESFDTAEAFTVRDGKFLAIGSHDEIMASYTSNTILDAKGMCIYPGFYDAHAHFMGYGLNLLTYADLSPAGDYNDVLDILEAHAIKNPDGWIQGRGWDQNKWPGARFPDKEGLDSLFPNRPVYLIRIDGHAALVNEAALKAAGITAQTKVAGGSIELRQGKPTGILIDNAMELVRKIIPLPDAATRIKALQTAEKNCLATGLTTVTDAGLPYNDIMLIDSLHQAGALKISVYAMLEPDEANIQNLLTKGIFVTDRLNARALKLYADGALGSRGACLLQPYADSTAHFGLMVNKLTYLEDMCRMAYNNGFQVCTHAIGDSANRIMLQLYASFLKGKNDLRWRIEHAQVLHENDFELFGQYNIIPSVQATHATSDMYWAEKRLGPERLKGAYAYKKLLEQNGMLCNGTDFPIENISPFYTFYAATVRKDLNGYPPEGFMPEQALTPREALLSMTLWAAYASFEENRKGSIEAGKQADFVVLDTDLIKTPTASHAAKALQTFIMGEKVFELR